jgi:hypothetical protein
MGTRRDSIMWTWLCRYCGHANDNNPGACRKCGRADDGDGAKVPRRLTGRRNSRKVKIR